MKTVLVFGLGLVALIVYTQLTVFVVQPIGAVPEGRTVIMTRNGSTDFIDSADGMCQRKMAGVSLICRMVAFSAATEGATIIGRFPYSEFLYTISTGGRKYDR